MTEEMTVSRGDGLITPAAPEMRRVLGHFCTGIAVISAHDGTQPIGFTCQSVTSVSLEPPYISFCPSNSSTSWPLIREAGTLCVNILAADQQDVCAQFATRGDDKFEGIDWRPGINGAPTLDGTLASIEAEVEFEHGAGDHSIVVARVTGLWAHAERAPLLFYRGGYGAFDGAIHA
ncbi:MAG: flavin reductase domain protein FMN-binding protein [Mycobacterium sp.]|nr:flavin reductase domain protein FMN-binding protein [Mycobacterium sp.]